MSLYTIPGLKRRTSTMNKSIVEANLTKIANSAGPFDIFLSQRKLDAEVIQALYDDLVSLGFKVYVDWIHDRNLDRTQVNKATAQFLKKRLRECKCLFYVATSNAPDSKWMPWELGFKDGHSDRVAILPIASTETTGDKYEGMEYLGIYPYVTKANTNDLRGKPKLWIHESPNTYIVFEDWLKGEKPRAR